jgi:hypothetical protein
MNTNEYVAPSRCLHDDLTLSFTLSLASQYLDARPSPVHDLLETARLMEWGLSVQPLAAPLHGRSTAPLRSRGDPGVHPVVADSTVLVAIEAAGREGDPQPGSSWNLSQNVR